MRIGEEPVVSTHAPSISQRQTQFIGLRKLRKQRARQCPCDAALTSLADLCQSLLRFMVLITKAEYCSTDAGRIQIVFLERDV
jgi:hypothetical protein